MEGRFGHLKRWMDPSEWLPRPNSPTRVVKKFHGPDPDDEYLIVKVVINQSTRVTSKWSPIIEIENEGGPKYLHLDTIPRQSDQWFSSAELAKLAAFEFLWPSDMDNWEGIGYHPYFEPVQYGEYDEWKLNDSNNTLRP